MKIQSGGPSIERKRENKRYSKPTKVTNCSYTHSSKDNFVKIQRSWNFVFLPSSITTIKLLHYIRIHSFSFQSIHPSFPGAFIKSNSQNLQVKVDTSYKLTMNRIAKVKALQSTLVNRGRSHIRTSTCTSSSSSGCHYRPRSFFSTSVLPSSSSSLSSVCDPNIDTKSNSNSNYTKRCVSSFTEPQPTLFDTDRATNNKDAAETNSNLSDLEQILVAMNDKQLRADVKTMGSILGSTIKQYDGVDILNKVESLRLDAKVRK